MESSAVARYNPQNSIKRVFPGSSSAFMDPEVVEVAPPSSDRTSKSKGKQKEVVYHEIIDVDMDEDRNDVVFVEGTVESNRKRKHSMGISLGPRNEAQSSKNMVHSANKVDSNKKGKEVASGAPLHFLKGFTPGSNNFFDLDDYVFEDDFLALQSHFDNMDVPTGIEASIPQFLNKPQTKKNSSAIPFATSHTQPQPNPTWTPVNRSTSKKYSSSTATPQKIKHLNNPYYFPDASTTQFISNAPSSFPPFLMDPAYPIGYNALTTDAYANAAFLPQTANMYTMDNHTLVNPDAENIPRSSGVVGSSSSMAKSDNEDVLKRYESFKKFDTVVDFSDHYYARQSSSMKQPPKNWGKKIQDEWRILEKDLPDTIFVRVYESRMDLLRAVIIGAEGTPYHDGLFFFDVCFPSSYPNSPPLVHYHSGGLRINPNLYESGKVCLSLLNTWTGHHNEKWVPGTSTMLQVLVSIQGLILNMKPYFNEPGFAHSSGSVHGEKSSLKYNESTLILSLRTMVYTMKKPPKNFKDLVIGHFRNRVRDILMACKAYTEGVQVGCLVKGGVQDVDEGNKSCSTHFKNDVASCVKTLVAEFKKIGAVEAEEFLHLSKKKARSPSSAPAPGSVHGHVYPPPPPGHVYPPPPPYLNPISYNQFW